MDVKLATSSLTNIYAHIWFTTSPQTFWTLNSLRDTSRPLVVVGRWWLVPPGLAPQRQPKGTKHGGRRIPCQNTEIKPMVEQGWLSVAECAGADAAGTPSARSSWHALPDQIFKGKQRACHKRSKISAQATAPECHTPLCDKHMDPVSKSTAKPKISSGSHGSRFASGCAILHTLLQERGSTGRTRTTGMFQPCLERLAFHPLQHAPSIECET